MTQITTQNQNLYQLQETVLKTLGGLLGQKSTHPEHIIHRALWQVCYVLRFVYPELKRWYNDDEKSKREENHTCCIKFAITNSVRSTHRSAHQYLRGQIEMTCQDDNLWLIRAVNVECLPIPDRFSDTTYQNTQSTARQLIDQILIAFKLHRVHTNNSEAYSVISNYLESLEQCIGELWNISKWQDPDLSKRAFCQSLKKLLGYTGYRNIKFGYEQGNLLIVFYYKGNVILVRHIALNDSLLDTFE